jgi:hypothetical protein
MNQEQIINLTLCEVCETDNMSIPIAKLCSNLGWSTILHLITNLPEAKEPDVYVNNYFEEIVPYYSEATFRSHFRMTRDTMAVSHLINGKWYTYIIIIIMVFPDID